MVRVPRSPIRPAGAKALELLGIKFEPPGFPLTLPGPDAPVTLWLPTPGLLDRLSPDETGIAVLGPNLEPIGLWGIATDLLARQDPALRELLLKANKKGQAAATLGHVYVTATSQAGQTVLLALAIDELGEAYLALRNAEKEVIALRRIGKSLAMNQTLAPLAMMTAHAIVGALDLAAVLLWTNHDLNETLDLVAYAGIDREASQKLRSLSLDTKPSFLAEQVAQSGESLWVPDPSRNPLTRDLEPKHCYLAIGPLAILPLRTAQQTVGVLELVAKERDHDFLESHELHNTIAEHLALALNSAILFEKVETLATTDPLTAIANHRTLQEFLAKSAEEAERSARPLGVVMLDVDHFRKFNEEEGHDCGDEVLRLVAQVLKSNMRPQDLAARYGGEEFTLVLPGMDIRSTTALAERVRAEIARIEFPTPKGQCRRVTASLGCAVAPQAGTTPTDLLKAADVALYDAKRHGRNQVQIAKENQGPTTLAS